MPERARLYATAATWFMTTSMPINEDGITTSHQTKLIFDNATESHATPAGFKERKRLVSSQSRATRSMHPSHPSVVFIKKLVVG